MASTEKILELIEKEDCLSILAENSLQENFNELLKYGLIDIVEDKVVLTPKGEEARMLGFEKFMGQKRKEDESLNVPAPKPRQRSKLYTLVMGSLIILSIIFLVAGPMGCSGTT
ncbi:hypothetical protein [Salinimicrobium sp. HB62]|uniref:hypothetical protein n=1 Tax=Salinimicrobium sp. HB62 TaxID=3077781 RepID=UPI002D76E0A0|nr:hypothetical protein [Salinimicrobium sp. HB62]